MVFWSRKWYYWSLGYKGVGTTNNRARQGRLARAVDVASMKVWLASEDASLVHWCLFTSTWRIHRDLTLASNAP